MRKCKHNIFMALIYEKKAGTIMEFSLWCTVCFVVLLSMIAAIAGKGNVTWILLMLFSIGLGVLMSFRLKAIAMLYSVGVFNFLTFIVHFICFVKAGSYWDYGASYSALNIVLFVILLLLSVGVLVCGFVHAFTKFNLGNALTVMMIADSSLIMILHILMYAVPYFGDSSGYSTSWLRDYLNYRGYWIGTVCFWIVLTISTLMYIFSFWGPMRSRNGKILNYNRGVGLQGIFGTYAGHTIYLHSGVVTIGSGAGVTIPIHDPYVSARHCLVRFNTKTGNYEIYDSSQNGVYLETGQKLTKGMYNALQRGTVIWIGSNTQKFKLL